MDAISGALMRVSTGNSRTAIRRTERLFGGCKFGRVVRSLWPHKSAEELAARARCTVRAAEYMLAGREPTARAIAAVIAEMLT